MASPSFSDNWETATPEVMVSSRAKLAGFIEAIPDGEKRLREVSCVFKCTDF